MTTVAEGVETSEQLEMLAQMGCDQSQGYLHSRPLPLSGIEPLLRAGLKTVPNSDDSDVDATASARRG
jgi:EAL domain-containing protein (putative c-di-GMP-specific phosphodiesterase class I)